MLLFLGLGMVLWAKWLMPEEEVVQDRHDGPSHRRGQADDRGDPARSASTTPACRAARCSCARSGWPAARSRTVPLVALVGGMIKKPGDQLFHTSGRSTRRSRDRPRADGLLRLAPGQPGRPRARRHRDRVPRRAGRATASTAYADLADAADPAAARARGQGPQGPGRLRLAGDYRYVAYSKICTHAGCPASLYEQQTSRLLCPCHQSQFEVLEDAKPVFGPATRSLPKLPLDVEIGDDGGSTSSRRRDFNEPIGPGFWERP